MTDDLVIPGPWILPVGRIQFGPTAAPERFEDTERKLRLMVAAPAMLATLEELYRVCLARESEDEAERPDEAEYQAAMRRAHGELVALGVRP